MSSFDPTSIWAVAAAAVLGYLLGSIPFGLVLTRAAGLGDIRSIGSGNIGATNVLRTGHKGLALATLLLDGGKGAIAVLVAGLFDPMLAVIAGGGAMLGHIFPVWLGFKGGKGVATALGTLLAIMWPVGVLCCLVWLAMAALFRYSSLAALAAIAAAPVLAWALSGTTILGAVWTDLPRAALALFIAVLVFLRHDGNIRRLLRGEEPKIGQKKAAAG
ncbi:glycerol-3-phosphate 1-O-acyltransferase PlsY [Inquilinus limosus]|uniref:Glycerol-3-phosphate acyltransferase n=1 Tax=Inquilinus limosus TaxID=171674 RepID=A0A211ZJA5_9PROT|nr:glycerol-3-phosphate 1-O-acyltransferase PlsY [Inquilinus limosus]OWJ65368.1 acyl-phosphate glycerol 3-phosphate acyltransferase [Inquilinus limosus]